MKNRIELRHLRYFVAVAEEKSFTRAAERLHMQQPPLSQQLKALESQLGTPLFERLPRGVELTAAGTAFLDDARSVLASVGAATARASRVGAGIEGALAVGLASSAATHEVVPNLIAAFRNRYPTGVPSIRRGKRRDPHRSGRRSGRGRGPATSARGPTTRGALPASAAGADAGSDR
jgi:DNA-binding transcriptional LysR family regulator